MVGHGRERTWQGNGKRAGAAERPPARMGRLKMPPAGQIDRGVRFRRAVNRRRIGAGGGERTVLSPRAPRAATRAGVGKG